MFTGIIQALGTVQSVTVEGDAKIFKVDTFGLVCNSQVGDSLSINGACMTLTAIEAGVVWFTTISESLNLTNLNDLLNGSPVNLELAATLNTVLGGHIVSGHIDTMAELIEIIPKATGQEVWINVPKKLMKFIILMNQKFNSFISPLLKPIRALITMLGIYFFVKDLVLPSHSLFFQIRRCFFQVVPI